MVDSRYVILTFFGGSWENSCIASPVLVDQDLCGHQLFRTCSLVFISDVTCLSRAICHLVSEESPAEIVKRFHEIGEDEYCRWWVDLFLFNEERNILACIACSNSNINYNTTAERSYWYKMELYKFGRSSVIICKDARFIWKLAYIVYL